jgi:hypothetical protein
LETLLSYGPAAKHSQLTSALYYKDTSQFLEEGNPLDPNGLNVGLKKRHSFIDNGRAIDLLGCIHSDLFFQDKYLPSDVGLRIRLVRSKDAFCLMSNVPADAHKVKILDCKLFVRKVKLSPSVFLAHAKALENSNAKYPVRRVICKTFTVPRGNLDFTQENLFSGQLPTRLVIGCVDNDSFNGTYTKNPFNFKHYHLSQLKLYLDGQQQHHVKPLEPNYTNGQYIGAYMSLFSGTGKQQKDEGNDIDRSDYPGGFANAIYAFDLRPDLAEEGHFNLAREGNVRVDIKFANALAATINVIAYTEF